MLPFLVSLAPSLSLSSSSATLSPSYFLYYSYTSAIFTGLLGLINFVTWMKSTQTKRFQCGCQITINISFSNPKCLSKLILNVFVWGWCTNTGDNYLISISDISKKTNVSTHTKAVSLLPYPTGHLRLKKDWFNSLFCLRGFEPHLPEEC